MPINKARFQPASAKQPPRPTGRRRAEAIIDRRQQLLAEVMRLRGEDESSTFGDNAMQLLTRWWASTGWTAREELLRAAEWLVRVEKRNRETQGAQ